MNEKSLSEEFMILLSQLTPEVKELFKEYLKTLHNESAVATSKAQEETI